MSDEIHILIAEDDVAIATALAMNLKLEGYRSTVTHDGDEALRVIGDDRPDLLLLDIGMPKKDGIELLRELRGAADPLPVIVLSARGGEYDKVAALRLGADDYVTKPFALAELMARLDAVLRRAAAQPSAPPSATVQHFGRVDVDLGTRAVVRDGNEVKLTHLEFELLRFFLANPSQVLSRDQLLREVWGTNGSRRTVDNFVGQLRAKLEDCPEDPRHFVTVRGSGYRFDK